MGIGLSLVKELVLNLKGRVAVESTEGKGSSFIIYLPRSTEEQLRLSHEIPNSKTGILA